MVAKKITNNFSTKILFRFFSWLNQKSTDVLIEVKDRFNDEVSQYEEDCGKDKCMFFGEIDGLPEKSDVKDLHKEYDESSRAKSSKKYLVIRDLQWVTLILFSALVSGIHAMDTDPNSKIFMIVFALLAGLFITRVQKYKLITTRADSYRARLCQIYLEKRYSKHGFISRKTQVDKTFRGNREIPMEDRDTTYEKYSLTNIELVSIFFIQMMYWILSIISFFILN